jgi:hypothetical protein
MMASSLAQGRKKVQSREAGIHSGSVRPDYHLQAEIVTIKLAFANATACQFIGKEPRRPASTEQRTSQQTVLRKGHPVPVLVENFNSGSAPSDKVSLTKV